MKHNILTLTAFFMLSPIAHSNENIDPPADGPTEISTENVTEIPKDSTDGKVDEILKTDENPSIDTVVTSDVTQPDSERKKLDESSAKIDSLKKEILNLCESMKQKDVEITDLRKANDQLKEASDKLQRDLISMASNFMYIPYDEYSIVNIAIPAFEATKGTDAYNTYQNRLPILQNYKVDMIDLLKTLSEMKREMDFTSSSDRKQVAKSLLDSLKTSPVYQRYISYSDWKGTYLGKKILKIENLLKAPGQDIPAQLEKIRKELETQLTAE